MLLLLVASLSLCVRACVRACVCLFVCLFVCLLAACWCISFSCTVGRMRPPMTTLQEFLRSCCLQDRRRSQL